MSLEQEMHDLLQVAFAPQALTIINESAQHHGHAGDDGTGESHWRVVIAAAAFEPMSRLARHRAVHAALGKPIIGRIHALALEISAPNT